MKEQQSNLKVVVIGGGTGLSTMLRGLKEYTHNITAIVTVSDNGGASGILRTEMGMIPPGDIRNCLVALANTEPIMEKLLQYRFKEGSLQGHNLGNLLLAAMTDLSGNFEKAVQVIGEVLAITGKVVPVTDENVNLKANFEDGSCIIGETQIVEYGKKHRSLIQKISLEPPTVKPLQDGIKALQEADAIILGPGSLYTSILPNVLIKEIAEAIRMSKAYKIYVANIMSQPGETIGFSIEDHIEEVERYIGAEVIQAVIVNNASIAESYKMEYINDGAHVLNFNPNDPLWHRIIRFEVPVAKVYPKKRVVRHDSKRLAEYIFKDLLKK